MYQSTRGKGYLWMYVTCDKKRRSYIQGTKKTDGGYTLLTVMMTMALMTVVVSMVFKMTWEQLQLGQMIKVTSTTRKMAATLPYWQAQEVEEAIALQMPLVASEVAAFYDQEGDGTMSQTIGPSKELKLLTHALMYKALVEAYTESSVAGPSFGSSKNPKTTYTYETDSVQKGRGTTCTLQVVFKENMLAPANSTAAQIKERLTDYGVVRDTLSNMYNGLLMGKPLTEQSGLVSLLQYQLEQNSQLVLRATCETLQPTGGYFDKQVAYEVIRLVPSDDLTLQIGRDNTGFSKGVIKLEKVCTQVERIP